MNNKARDYYKHGLLHFRLTSMDEVHRTHKLEADKLEHDIGDSEMSIVNCEASSPKLEDRFRFFQEMRGYVRDLVECLNEKVGSSYMLGWPSVICSYGIAYLGWAVFE